MRSICTLLALASLLAAAMAQTSDASKASPSALNDALKKRQAQAQNVKLPVPANLERRTLKVGGVEREFFLHVPDGVKGKPAPVVFALTTPLAPETVKTVSAMNTSEIWSRYVRYIGAGAVATAGIITVLRGLPSMLGAFTAVARGIKRKPGGHETSGPVPERDRDLPGYFIFGAIIMVVLVAGFVPGIFAGGMSLGPRMVCAAGVGIFGLMFVAVAARIVGIVGVSSQPASGITLRTAHPT